jgi:hypothetical protein
MEWRSSDKMEKGKKVAAVAAKVDRSSDEP